MNWFFNELMGNIFNNIRLLIDFIASPFLNPGKFIRKVKGGTLALPAGVKRALVFLCVLAVVTTLGILTWALGLDRHASGPWFFRKTWMGWLALLGYFIIKASISVLRQIRLLPPLLKSWPDISRAMDAGRQAVSNAEFRIDRTPVFIVVGLSQAAEHAFAESEQVGDIIRVNDPELPVHWYGDENALWITLPSVSCVAAQTELLEQLSGVSSDDGVSSSSLATLTGDIVVGSNRSRANRKEVLVTANQRSTARSRMAYFCHELRQARDPVCAANGVLLMLPFNQATMAEKYARGLSECLRSDMSVLQQDLGVQCLTLTVLTSNNDHVAFRSYIRNLDPESVKRRCGIGFPQLTHLEDGDSSLIYDWLVRDFELQAMHLYRESPGAPDNEAIFAFLDSIREGRKHFAGMLSSAFAQDVSNRFYFGGLYLAELSAVGEQSTPFLNGVLAKAMSEHDELISWSEKAIATDAHNRRVSYMLFAVTALMLMVSVGMVWNLVS